MGHQPEPTQYTNTLYHLFQNRNFIYFCLIIKYVVELLRLYLPDIIEVPGSVGMLEWTPPTFASMSTDL